MVAPEEISAAIVAGVEEAEIAAVLAVFSLPHVEFHLVALGGHVSNNS